MTGNFNKRNHPVASYVIGFFFIAITLLVLAGVIHHLTVSPHGPGLLRPVVDRFFAKPESPLLDEVRQAAEMERHRHFHHITDYPQLPEQDRPVCFICHSDYPHKQNKRVRALLNMHTQYLMCESCHIQEKEGARIVYKWYNPQNPDPQGPFLGTSYDPQTGYLFDVADKLSKIAPYYVRTGEAPQSAVLTQDAPQARDYMQVRDKLTPEQREGVKNLFHKNIQPKGYECKACHAEKGILDLAGLGFSEKRVADLEKLNITGMLTKYEVFYLPELFGPEQPPPAPEPGKTE